MAQHICHNELLAVCIFEKGSFACSKLSAFLDTAAALWKPLGS